MRRVTKLFLSTVLLVLFAAPAHAALLDRGNGLIYDDVLDITWSQNANLGGVLINWDNAVSWADGLVFGGFNDWRLASMSVSSGVPTGQTFTIVDCSTATELACRDNELGYMYRYNLVPCIRKR